eukprot:XP_011665071.1 PREDICTED: contactin-3 [Strongylocentrotus purpuratus]
MLQKRTCALLHLLTEPLVRVCRPAGDKDLNQKRHAAGESTGSNSVRLIDLDPFSLYSFRVIAVNRIGRGTPSEPVEADVKTGKTAPTASPSNVGGGGGNTGDLRITWDKFPTSKWNSETVSYKVEWQKVDSRVSSIGLLEEPNAIIYTATLGIDLYTQYRVRVQARNGEGEGPFSEWAVIYSYQEAPKTAPTGVKAERASGTTINVSWDAIDESTFEGELLGYKVTGPNIVIGTESWLSDGINSNRVFLDKQYTILRRDRPNDPHGRVYCHQD